MSSSEPPLTYGAGPPEAGATVVPRTDLGRPTSGGRVGSPSARRSSPAADPRKRSDPLPPLVSLSDLILDAPAWLFSAALHMLAVIVLGLLFIVPERTEELLLRLDDSDGFEELSGSEFDLALDTPEQSDAEALEPQELEMVEEPVLIEPTEINPMVVDTESIVVSAPIQLALTGRSQGMQQRLLDAYGGTGQTQKAVMDALRWLRRYQTSQGMWSLQGKYENGAGAENREAATGLALIAFQGAGYTPDGDPQHDFTQATAHAWKALLKKQNEDGSFFHTGTGNSQLYTHAICTIALCELYGMTHNSRYREPAQRAIDYCVRAQSSTGGWRYYPGGSDSDLSVTGWFVMALQSARMAGLEVPTPVLQRISGYLDSVSHGSGNYSGVGYSYQPKGGPTAAMTAEGLLCRQYLGWKQTDPRLQAGADLLVENLPAWVRGERDVYYWYYATQVCHHMEGEYWRTWNDSMKVVLPENQVQQGKERGSWDPQGDRWGPEGGRLYVTCLSTYMLEVYYRHLPIYKLNELR